MNGAAKSRFPSQEYNPRAEVFEMIDVLSECDPVRKVAGRQGVSRIVFRTVAGVRSFL